MTLPNLVGAPHWLWPACLLATVGLLALVSAYWRGNNSLPFRLFAGSLKACAIVLLAFLLLEPMRNDRVPKAGANLFLLLADGSQSLLITDRGQDKSRETQLRRLLDESANWQERLETDFDLRRYIFDRRLSPTSDFSELEAGGIGSELHGSLSEIARRYQGRPTAGILVFSDGNATDRLSKLRNVADLPPVYPVMIGQDKQAVDIAINKVSVNQTNFETAPVTVAAELSCTGYAGKSIVTQLLDEQGNELDRQVVSGVEDQKPFAVRFQIRPDKRGVLFYRIRALEKSVEQSGIDFNRLDRASGHNEATLINNQRLVKVDRDGGPHRVLYVCGRPNWELKFLRRAIAGDDEIDLLALVRIAKREPRFSFRGHIGETTNPLFRGFGSQNDERAEQYDEPVFLRLGTKDENELRDGFPKSAKELFCFDAIVLDDVESDFFNQDQKSLIQQFVSQRGGGLLMLGGQESFVKGNYDHTPIAELLPVYVDRLNAVPETASGSSNYQLELTREGWRQPWVRVRPTEQQERQRLDQMPRFKTVNQVSAIKPGATVLASVVTEDNAEHPALVVQRFGKGRSAAWLIGDLWRWQLQQSGDRGDLMKTWRQTVRWLVADIPQRVEVEVQGHPESGVARRIQSRARDESYELLDNCSVQVEIETPEGKKLELTADPVADLSGVYEVEFVPRTAGAYRATAIATDADGTEIGRRQTGWASQPGVEEFRKMQPNRAVLEALATATGGEMVAVGELNRFVRELPNRKIPVTEPRVRPWWHNWSFFLIAVTLLTAEWGLRRWKGLR